ncbi:MAG: hypothetical protein R3B99_20200 [Polyangiales bacterium]|nr:hypothetical protein [Sandaracinus sp.]
MIDDDTNKDLWPEQPLNLFTEDGPWKAHANIGWIYQGWRLSTWNSITDAYEGCATELIRSVESGQLMPDFAFFPLVHLWRHYLELALKSIIATGKVLEGEEAKFPHGHNLMKLWEGARRVLEKHEVSIKELDNVAPLLEQLSQIDPTHTGFRYAFRQDGKTPGLEGIPMGFNLVGLHNAMKSAARFFGGCAGHLEHIQDCQQYEREYAEDYTSDYEGGWNDEGDYD